MLVVVEGPDGVGKSTLCSELAATLRAKGVSVHSSSFPGRDAGTLGELVYEIHHQSTAQGIVEITPLALQTLHVAAHIDAIERRFVPILNAGAVLILDRYWWSTLVYGGAAGVSLEALRALIATEKIAWGDIRPTVVSGLTRDSPHRQELTDAQWADVSERYARLADDEERVGQRVVRLSSDQAPRALVAEVMSTLNTLGIRD